MTIENGSQKVLYKTRVKVKLPHKKTEQADCLVTEDQVIIETEEPVRIPASCIGSCDTEQHLDISFSYSNRPHDPFNGTATITFRDEQNNKQVLPLNMAAEDMHSFKSGIAHLIVGKFSNFIEKPTQEKPSRRFSFGFKEALRDKTRDNICSFLETLGIDAKMVERGRIEEDISNETRGRLDSIGLIAIAEGPIRWVNLARVATSQGYGGGGSTYMIEFGVRDSKLTPDFPEGTVKSVHVKTAPLVGKIVDVHWEGADFGMGLVDSLNGDYELKQTIMRSGDVVIRAHVGYYCWLISNELDVFDQRLWDCYQAIARKLLAK